MVSLHRPKRILSISCFAGTGSALSSGFGHLHHPIAVTGFLIGEVERFAGGFYALINKNYGVRDVSCGAIWEAQFDAEADGVVLIWGEGDERSPVGCCCFDDIGCKHAVDFGFSR